MNETEPLIPDDPRSHERTAPAPSAVRYRVLVVEDEDLMRSIIAQLLRSEGYESSRRTRPKSRWESSKAKKSTSRFST